MTQIYIVPGLRASPDRRSNRDGSCQTREWDTLRKETNLENYAAHQSATSG